jgi:hypothetical protein
VLSRDGGLLARMLPPFKLGLGTRVGDGMQWMSWIPLDDCFAILKRLLHDEQMRGPYNLTAPQPATNADFTKALASALRRPAPFVAPAALLKMSMGESASLILEGQRVLPRKLEVAHYRFQFSTLQAALKDLLD